MARARQIIRSISLSPIRAPAIALSFAAIAAVLCVIAASRLKPDTSLESMFSRDDPAAAALLHIMHDFPAADELLILAAAPGEPAPERLRRFAQRLEQSLKS